MSAKRRRDDTSTPSSSHKTPKMNILDVLKSRFPRCTVNATKLGISEWSSVIPISIEIDDVEYDIQDWLGLGLCHPKNDGTVPEKVKENIARILKPLEFLYFNRTTQLWSYKQDCVLSSAEQTITQGFVSDLSNSRGRGMVFSLISQLFNSETSMKVVNIGGGSTVNEPSVREIVFKMTFEPSETNSSPSDSPSKLPLESSPKVFKFVPDIILESARQEHLLVEIQKGKVIYPQCVSQLRYMLMPAAIKQGTAVGVLICANKAVLEKCIAANNEVKFERYFYELRENSLVADMEDLLTDIYCKTVHI